MPFIVATYVYASSQGQRTHSARTKMSYLLNPDITVGCIICKGSNCIVMTLVVLTTTQGGPIHPHHALLVAQGGVPATHHPGAGGGAGEGYRGS